MSALPALLISVEGIDATQSALIHEAIKRSAKSWWHQQKSVWVVETDEPPAYWRDLINPFLDGVGGNALILRLPEPGRGRAWATRGLGSEWFRERYIPRREREIEGSERVQR